MEVKIVHVEVAILSFFGLIFCPNTKLIGLRCSRDNSKLVRKIIDLKWSPLLQKYKVAMSIQCPFHPYRDMFRSEYEAKKCNHHQMWMCRTCGKLFSSEFYFETHYDNRHGPLPNREDAICLSDYCDIVRCDVFSPQEVKTNKAVLSTLTGIDVWKSSTRLSTNKIRQTSSKGLKTNRGQINFYNHENPIQSSWQSNFDICSSSKMRYVEKQKDISFNGGSSDAISNLKCEENLIQIIAEQADKTNELLVESRKLHCMQEELSTLKQRCESLVRTCIFDSLLLLSNKDFLDLEEELKQAMCSYLTCDKYWKDQTTDQLFIPWAIIIIGALCISIGVCFCYYIVWIFFESKEIDNWYGDNQGPFYKSSCDSSLRKQVVIDCDTENRHTRPLCKGEISNEAPSNIRNEHYIFVTYPSDMKERFVENLND